MRESPVQPRDASTVILVRRGQTVGEPWQCFMVRRHALSDFAADVYVFPGGKVDDADYDPALSAYVTGHPSPATDQQSDETWRALRLAAVRELFEEAGVLLAVRGADVVSLHDDEDRFARYRAGLLQGELTLLEMARAERLQFALDRLHPFSRWITPDSFPRRYDTHFFVAHLPAHQEPLHDARETTNSTWIAPQTALAQSDAGRFPLVFATWKHLEKMAQYRSIEDMIAATAVSNLQPVVPKMIQRDGHEEFLIPGDPGYQ